MAVQIELGSNCIVQNNTLLNSNANGISISNSVNNSAKGRGSGHQVLNNVVNGASDVGISVWEGIGTLVHGNTVENITMNVSPYMQNTHDGIIFEGAGPCTNVTFSNNTIRNILSPTTKYQGTAIWGGPDGSSNIQYLNNTFQNVWQMARLVGSVTGITLTGNKVNGTVGLIEPVLFVTTDPDGNSPSNVNIQKNVFTGTPSGMIAFIINLQAGAGEFINNTIYTNGNKAIGVANPTSWISSPNTIH